MRFAGLDEQGDTKDDILAFLHQVGFAAMNPNAVLYVASAALTYMFSVRLRWSYVDHPSDGPSLRRSHEAISCICGCRRRRDRSLSLRVAPHCLSVQQSMCLCKIRNPVIRISVTKEPRFGLTLLLVRVYSFILTIRDLTGKPHGT